MRSDLVAATEPPLLPNEPRVLDAERQQALTVEGLLPFLGDLEALFIGLRHSVDGDLRQARPTKRGRPYPLGQCLEISQAVGRRLATIDGAGLAPAALRGWQRLLRFREAGGSLRQVWGDLRGEYFQNAFLMGTLYVDVANDTVDPRKPPVEIRPLVDSGLRAITDFRHFSRVAERYWQGRVFPNHALPALAPYFPLMTLTGDGFLQCQSACDYMIALNVQSGFRLAAAVLGDAPTPAALFPLIHSTLAPLGMTLPEDPVSGREQALRYCSEQPSGIARDRAVRDVLDVNRHLARLEVTFKHEKMRAWSAEGWNPPQGEAGLDREGRNVSFPAVGQPVD